jgi:hypothetical protein
LIFAFAFPFIGCQFSRSDERAVPVDVDVARAVVAHPAEEDVPTSSNLRHSDNVIKEGYSYGNRHPGVVVAAYSVLWAGGQNLGVSRVFFRSGVTAGRSKAPLEILITAAWSISSISVSRW